MATVIVQAGVTAEKATFDSSEVGVVPLPRHANARAQLGRSSCCRCREAIVQGVIAEAPQMWVTAAESDPWCQGGAHLPKAIHVTG